MDRRTLIKGAAAAAVLAPFAAVRSATPQAATLYDRATVIDACGSLVPFDPNDAPGLPLLPRFLADLKASGVTGVVMTVGGVGNGPGMFEEAVGAISYYDREIATHPGALLQVRAAADLREAKASGRVGVIYGFQDTTMLEGDLDRLETFDNLGVRVVQPTYNRRNLMGDGCLEPNDGGLSLLGRDLVAALNTRRMLVDLSHAGPRTQADGLVASKAPCAITHSGCRALHDHPRNTADRELRALADKGGVMGIYFMPYLRASGQQTSADVIRHIEHAVKVAGEDHVGLGTDGAIPPVIHLDAYRQHLADVTEQRRAAGIAAPGEDPDVMLFAPEYNTPRRFETLADDLMKRGHSTARVEKIVGGNFARLFAEVWG